MDSPCFGFPNFFNFRIGCSLLWLISFEFTAAFNEMLLFLPFLGFANLLRLLSSSTIFFYIETFFGLTFLFFYFYYAFFLITVFSKCKFIYLLSLWGINLTDFDFCIGTLDCLYSISTSWSSTFLLLIYFGLLSSKTFSLILLEVRIVRLLFLTSVVFLSKFPRLSTLTAMLLYLFLIILGKADFLFFFLR